MNQNSPESLTYIHLKVGMYGFFKEKNYQIIGRSRWNMNYKEYYQEENSSGYSQEYWTYDEWILRSGDDEMLYLIEDKEGFKLAEAIDPPLKPILEVGKHLFTNFYNSNQTQRIKEYGYAQIAFMEGKMEDDIQIGTRKIFFQYFDIAKNAFFNLEYREDKPIEEREYYKEVKITKKDVLTAFADYKEMQMHLHHLQTARWATLLLGLGCLVFLVMFIMSFSYRGTLISETIPLSKLSDTAAVSTSTWKIDDTYGLYLMEMQFKFMSLNANSNLNEVFISSNIYDEKEGIINSLIGDFYYETGRDSDGPWTDTQTYAYQYVRSEKAGTFFAQFYGEKQFPEIDGYLKFQVKKCWFLWYYTLTGFLVLLFAWIVSAILLSNWSN